MNIRRIFAPLVAIAAAFAHKPPAPFTQAPEDNPHAGDGTKAPKTPKKRAEIIKRRRATMSRKSRRYNLRTNAAGKCKAGGR